MIKYIVLVFSLLFVIFLLSIQFLYIFKGKNTENKEEKGKKHEEKKGEDKEENENEIKDDRSFSYPKNVIDPADLKSIYIQYLKERQSPEYTIHKVSECLSYLDKMTFEKAYVFSIEARSGNMIIVYENINYERATYVFVVSQGDYQNTLKELIDYFEGVSLDKRNNISRNVKKRFTSIKQFRKLMHDDVEGRWKWMMDYIIESK